MWETWERACHIPHITDTTNPQASQARTLVLLGQKLTQVLVFEKMQVVQHLYGLEQ
jgi:hypothetical protein